MKLRIILVGEEAAGIQTLKILSRLKHQVVAVMASPSRVADRGATLWNVAGQMGYQVLPSVRVKDPSFADQVVAERVDIILNVHSMFIMNAQVVAAPRIGSFNVHPGPLPRYAGLNPVSWALYNGETSHGVTLHKIVPEIDAGPIVYQSIFEIQPGDTALSLLAKCAQEGVAMVLRLLEQAALSPHDIPLEPQDLSRREYFDRSVPEMARIRWERPAREIVNLIRACDFSPFTSPWGRPRSMFGGNEVSVMKAGLTGIECDATPGTVGQITAAGIQVAARDEWVEVRRLSISGKTINPSDVLNPGDSFEKEQ